MIRFDNVTKTYKGTTVALHQCSVEIDKGEFVFLVGPSGSGKTTFIRLLLREETPDSGRIWEAGKEIGHLLEVAHPLSPPEHRLCLPGLPAAAQQERLRERGLRPRGHRPAQARHQPAGSPGPGPRGPVQEAQQPSPRALRWRAAAGGRGPGLREPAADPAGRRAHREPGPDHQPRHHAALDRINRTGTTVVIATHDAGMVDQMRRRVIELDRGVLVRDQARGVYGIDSAIAAQGAGSPTGTVIGTVSTEAWWPKPDARLGWVRLQGSRHQSVAEPAHDHRCRVDGGRVPGPCGLGTAVEAGRLERHHPSGSRAWTWPCSSRPGRRTRNTTPSARSSSSSRS